MVDDPDTEVSLWPISLGEGFLEFQDCGYPSQADSGIVFLLGKVRTESAKINERKRERRREANWLVVKETVASNLKRNSLIRNNMGLPYAWRCPTKAASLCLV